MKKYKVEFSIKITEGHGDLYDPPVPAKISVSENVPEGESPVKVIASRIASELKRIEAKSVIDWEADDKDPVDSISEIGSEPF